MFKIAFQHEGKNRYNKAGLWKLVLLEILDKGLSWRVQFDSEFDPFENLK